MERSIEKMKSFAPLVLRAGLGLVFLWFGSEQLLHTSMWTSLIPHFAISLTHLSAETLVHLNGSFEIVFGLCLIAGYFTRLAAFLLFLHLVAITFDVGYNAIGVRDFGLSVATLALALDGSSKWSLDDYFFQKNSGSGL